MLFPNGRLPWRRWRTLLGLVVVAAVSRVAVELLGSASVTGHFSGTALLAANPSGILPVSFENSAAGVSLYVGTWLLSLLVMAGAAVALLTRLVRAHAEERQQLKWLALLAVLTVAAFLVPFLIHGFWGSSPLDLGSVPMHIPLIVGA